MQREYSTGRSFLPILNLGLPDPPGFNMLADLLVVRDKVKFFALTIFTNHCSYQSVKRHFITHPYYPCSKDFLLSSYPCIPGEISYYLRFHNQLPEDRRHNTIDTASGSGTGVGLVSHLCMILHFLCDTQLSFVCFHRSYKDLLKDFFCVFSLI